MLEILVGAKYHVDGVGVAMGEDVGGVRDIEQGKVDSVRTSSKSCPKLTVFVSISPYKMRREILINLSSTTFGLHGSFIRLYQT